ncbi:hypothetical protein [Companilactobacillus baiquanensis]|nr:hypothetical protein [Companilactobacillus baiquanensis]
MSKKIYYSAMQHDKLIMPWQTDSKNILNALKRYKGVVLVKLMGDKKYSLDDLIDIGDLYVYKQETMDDFMNEKTCGSIYLDSAFTLIDQLENYPLKNDLGAVYLATALAQKLKLSKKLTYLLIVAFISSLNHNLFDNIEDFYQTDWNDFDKRFLNKLIEEPYQAPNFDKQEIKIEFSKFTEYSKAAKAFQDLYQLSKIHKIEFSLVDLQLKESFELIQMALEMKSFFK